MTNPRPWTVLHPGPLTLRAENLWTVDDDIPGIPGAGRRMAIIRQRSGALVFYNAIPLPEATLAEVHALGKPTSLVLPNHLHALDAHAFMAKLGVTAYAPKPGLEPLAKNGVTARDIAELPLDEGQQVVSVEGFNTHEAVLVVNDTLIVADLLTNVPHRLSLTGLMLRVMDFSGDVPKLPKPVRKRVMRDTASVQATLRQLAKKPLKRLVPSHGTVLEQGVTTALENLAATLA